MPTETRPVGSPLRLAYRLYRGDTWTHPPLTVAYAGSAALYAGTTARLVVRRTTSEGEAVLTKALSITTPSAGGYVVGGIEISGSADWDGFERRSGIYVADVEVSEVVGGVAGPVRTPVVFEFALVLDVAQ